jgi:superfamily II DNA/RNA helicase
MRRLRDLIGDPSYKSLLSGFSQFRFLGYQILACELIVKRLEVGKNTLLLLDPGLGKTLVSQLSFLSLRHRACPCGRKALVLVPSRLLRDQHSRAASWFHRDIGVLNLDPDAARFPGALRRSFENASWIVTTPKRLENALKRDYLLRKACRSISLCVVDEFDAQAAEDVDEDGEPIGRLSKAAQGLVSELTQNRAAFLCMSATIRTAAEPWLKTFKLERIRVPKRLVGDFAAYVRLCTVPVRDSQAIQADRLIDLVVIDTLRKIREILTDDLLVNPDIDPDRLRRQASKVLEGSRHHLFFPELGISERVVPLSRMWNLLARFLRAHAERLALYEGRLSSIEMKTYERMAETEDGKRMKVTSVREVSYTSGPTPNRKLTHLVTILRKQAAKTKGLVLVRNSDVNEFVSTLLTSKGIRNSRITGEMSDDRRRKALIDFESNVCDILIVNRQLGGRGFDLPRAEFAVFLSPKRSEETMWQEMLRIRSRRDKPKPVYVMHFSNTREEEKWDSFTEAVSHRLDRYELDQQDIGSSRVHKRR